MMSFSHKATTMTHRIAVSIVLMLLPLTAWAQVPVSMAPPIKFQFLSNAGIPLANGCVFTYQGGTVNPAATYVDSTGVGQNTNPIILDAGGRADIWIPNAAFKFVLKTVGGVNCATGSQLWSVDNVTGILGLLNLSNTWTGVNTFNLPVVIAVNANQLVTGLPGAQTTLNFPAPAGNITQNMPSIADTIMGKASTCSPNTAGLFLRDNGTQIACSTIQTGDVSNTSFTLTNNAGTPTILNSLAKLFGPPTSVGASTTADTGGIVGICVSGCGNSGSAIIQQVGLAGCNFDGATTANDYVQNSPTIAGDCRDSGGTFPTNGQVIGRVLSSQGVAGTYTMLLFSPEIKSLIPPVVAVNTTGLTANVGVTTLLTVPANGFYRVSCYVVETTSAGTSSTLPQCQVNWTDADSNVVQSSLLTVAITTNLVGSVGLLNMGASAPIPHFYAKSGTVISYQTNNYASNPASAMAYAIHVRLEGPL